jgi:hypothetical protein
MGRFDALTQLEKKQPYSPSLPSEENKTVASTQSASLLANQQTSKETNQHTDKPESLHASKEASEQTNKLTEQQTSKLASQQTTKEKKKYGTYLREDSIYSIQMKAIRTKRRDHEVLQEIVDLYFSK